MPSVARAVCVARSRFCSGVPPFAFTVQAHLDGDHVRLFTKSGLDWTDRMPGIAGALRWLPCHSAVLDGEAIIEDAEGVSDFFALHAKLQLGSAGGQPVRLRPLEHRWRRHPGEAAERAPGHAGRAAHRSAGPASRRARTRRKVASGCARPLATAGSRASSRSGSTSPTPRAGPKHGSR